jgi:hypothetical protein
MQPLDYQTIVDSRITDLVRNSPLFRAIQTSFAGIVQSKQDELFALQEAIFNIDKSTGKNLDLIGEIVGQKRQLIGIDDNPYFGFDEVPNAQTFGSTTNPSTGGVFRSIINNPYSTNVRGVDDATYRLLLKARIISNKYTGTINDTLKVINILAGNTTTKIENGSAGECTIVITSPVSPLLDYFLSQRNRPKSLIPIPLGINTKIAIV